MVMVAHENSKREKTFVQKQGFSCRFDALKLLYAQRSNNNPSIASLVRPKTTRPCPGRSLIQLLWNFGSSLVSAFCITNDNDTAVLVLEHGYIHHQQTQPALCFLEAPRLSFPSTLGPLSGSTARTGMPHSHLRDGFGIEPHGRRSIRGSRTFTVQSTSKTASRCLLTYFQQTYFQQNFQGWYH